MRRAEEIQKSLTWVRGREARYAEQARNLATQLAEAEAAERRVTVTSYGNKRITFHTDTACAALHMSVDSPRSSFEPGEANLDPRAAKALKEFFNRNF